MIYDDEEEINKQLEEEVLIPLRSVISIDGRNNPMLTKSPSETMQLNPLSFNIIFISERLNSSFISKCDFSKEWFFSTFIKSDFTNWIISSVNTDNWTQRD